MTADTEQIVSQGNYVLHIEYMNDSPEVRLFLRNLKSLVRASQGDICIYKYLNCLVTLDVRNQTLSEC